MTNNKEAGKNNDCEQVKYERFFRLNYICGGLSLLLLGVLIFIALFVRDDFIRPFVGDVLVVVWLYCSISSVCRCNPLKLAGLVCGIAFMIEIRQYLQMLHWFGEESNAALKVILGTTFDWLDLVAYLVGAAICVFVDRSWLSKSSSPKSEPITE